MATTTADRRGIATVATALLLAVVYGLGHAPYAYLGGDHYGAWLFMEVARTIAWLAVLGVLMWHVHRSPRPWQHMVGQRDPHDVPRRIRAVAA